MPNEFDKIFSDATTATATVEPPKKNEFKEVFAANTLLDKSEILLNGLLTLSQGRKFKNTIDEMSGYSFIIEDEESFVKFLEHSEIRFIIDNNIPKPTQEPFPFNLDNHKKEFEQVAQIMKNKLTKQKNEPLKIETADDLISIKMMNVHDKRIRADKLLDRLFKTEDDTQKDFIKRQLRELRS